MAAPIAACLRQANYLFSKQQGLGRLLGRSYSCCHHQGLFQRQHVTVTQAQRLYSGPAAEHELDDLYKSVQVEVKGHDPTVLNSYQTFVSLAAQELNINISKIWSPPRVIERRTLLKSIHIYKKHRVQYEMRTYYRVLELSHLTGSTADTFLEYIERNLPEGMAMKVTKDRIEAIPEHIKPPTEETVPSS